MTTLSSLYQGEPMLKKSVIAVVTLVGLGAIVSVIFNHLNES